MTNQPRYDTPEHDVEDVPTDSQVSWGDELDRVVPVDERAAVSYSSRTTWVTDDDPAQLAGYDPDRSRVELVVYADVADTPQTVMIGTRPDVAVGQGFRLTAYPGNPARLELHSQREVWAMAPAGGCYVSVLVESNR